MMMLLLLLFRACEEAREQEREWANRGVSLAVSIGFVQEEVESTKQ